MSVTGWVRLAVLATAFIVPAATLQAGDDWRRGKGRGGKHFKHSRSYRGGGGYYGGGGYGGYYAPPMRGGYRYAPPPRRVVIVERPVPVPVYVDRYGGRRGGGYGYGYREPAYYPPPRVSVGVGVVIR